MNVINDFLQYKSRNTQKNYTWILNEYFKEIKQKPDNYFKTKRDYKIDINKWWLNHLDEVPTTRHTKLNVLKSFFDEYEILFPKKFWIKLRRMRKGNRPTTIDRTPTPTEFKKILQNSTIKDKTLFTFIFSSGMRVSEVLQIKPEHIDLKHDPVKINIPGDISKTGNPRITFISDESKEYLQEWLENYREPYLKTAVAKTTRYKKNQHDTRVFPFSYNIAWTRWLYLLKKAKLDERDPTTKRYLLHIHCLRKHFLSQMKLKIPEVIAEALAGHEGYLGQAYRRYSKQELAEFYKQGMDNVTVFNVAPDLTGVNQEINELKTENKELLERLKIQELKMQGLENKLAIEEIKNGK